MSPSIRWDCRSPTRTFIAVALTALATAGTSASAATWSAPVAVGSTHNFIDTLRVLQPYASTVAAWEWRDGFSNTSTGAMAVLPNRGSGFGPETALPKDISDLQSFVNSGLIAALQTQTHATTRTRPAIFRVGVATGHAGGTFGREQALAEASTVGAPALGVSQGGKAVIAFIEFDPRTNRRIVLASIRDPASGRFTKPAVLAGRGQAEVVTAAAGDNNDLVVAWVSQRHLYARFRRHGHTWGPTQQLAAVDEPTFWQIVAAVDTRGRAELVWQRTLKGSDHPSKRVIEATYRPVGSHRFRAAQVVEPSYADDIASLVKVPAGWALAYRVRHAGISVVSARVRYLAPGPGPAIDVGAGAPSLRGLRVAWSPLHGLFATWGQSTGAPRFERFALGAFAPSTSPVTFGPPELISPTSSAGDVWPSFDPITQVPRAVWISRTDATGPPSVDLVKSTVLTATRSG